MKSTYLKTRLSYNAARDTIWKVIGAYLQRYIPRDAIIVDLGAGYCNFINNIRAKERHAVDMIPEIKNFVKGDVIAHQLNVSRLKGFKNNSVDVVFTSNLFEHLTRDEMLQSLHEIYRILKYKGRLIIIQPNFKYAYREYFDDYTHLQIFTDMSLSDILKGNGFKVVINKPKFLPFSMKSNLPSWGWLIWLYLRLPFKPKAGQMLLVAVKPSQKAVY